jgi:hypothetical protein
MDSVYFLSILMRAINSKFVHLEQKRVRIGEIPVGLKPRQSRNLNASTKT